MNKTLYGDAFISLNFKSVDYGEPDKMHDIFEWAINHGAPSLKNSHPLNIYQRVLNGLDRYKRFKKFYIKYTGIYNNRVRYFELK